MNDILKRINATQKQSSTELAQALSIMSSNEPASVKANAIEQLALKAPDKESEQFGDLLAALDLQGEVNGR